MSDRPITSGSHLLPPEWLPKLERLTLSTGRRVAGTLQGKRRSRKLGSSLEFADYRNYTPGDDIRRFDWGVYARTGKPFIRQFMDEQELLVSIYVDCSASMGFGEKSAAVAASGRAVPSKLTFAKQLAAAIGYIALCSYERLQGACYNDVRHTRLPLVRGKSSVYRLFSFLEEAQAEGEGSLAQFLSIPGAAPRLPGMTWIFSDFWLEDGAEELGRVLSRLIGAGQEVVLVQVVSREEIDPTLSGDLKLIDSELATGKDVALTGKVLQQYREEWSRYGSELSSFAAERGVSYMIVPNDVTLQQAVFEIMAGANLIST